MKKLRSIICVLVALSLAAMQIVCASAAVPEDAVINLLPEDASAMVPLNGHETHYSDEVIDGSYAMTLLADGAVTSGNETNFAQSEYYLGGITVDINKTPVIKFKSHFTLPENSQFKPRINIRITCTAEGQQTNLWASIGLADYFDVNDNSINTDQDTTINLYEALDRLDMIPVSGSITVDQIDFCMGGDEGLVLTIDYMYFAEATPTVDGSEVNVTAVSSAPASVTDDTSSVTAKTSSPAKTNDDGSGAALYVVIGVAAVLIVAGVVIFIVVKSRGSKAPKAETKPNDNKSDSSKE